MGQGFHVLSTTPKISSLLIKPASALCNLDCSYCFYLDRAGDPYSDLHSRRMSEPTLERLTAGFLEYSYPNSAFAFQGGEPTLAGPAFFEKLIALQKQHGRGGQSVSNALQTNGTLLTDRFCELFRAYNWLIGISIDGPEHIHDQYRMNKAGAGTWRKVMAGVELLKKHGVEFNALCVLSQANVEKAPEIYQFFRSLGIDYLQFIPLSEFDAEGNPLPFTITPEQYGRFLYEIFELWWPDRRTVRIRYFDNLAEAIGGLEAGTCTLHKSCDSYAVVEFNGDVYPCDFFVEKEWKLGNVNDDSWDAIAANQRRYEFASKKAIPHPACEVCQYQRVCQGGCPKDRHSQHGNFQDLDYFCQAYRMIFRKAVRPLAKEVEKLTGLRPVL